jgi:Ca2+/Na+ antiporter
MYIYYKIWQNFSRTKTNDMPATNAMLFVSLCHLANIFVIQIVLGHYSLVNMKFSSKYEIYIYTIPLGLLVFALNYLLLYKKRDRIFEKYKNENKKQKLIGSILVISYILVSFVLVFYLGIKYSPTGE